MPDIYKKIKAEYIRGGISYQKLADKYRVSLSSVTRRATKEKWAELKKQSEQKANIKIVNSAADKEAKRADMFDTITDKLLQHILTAVENGDIDTKRGYRDITGALKDLRDIKGLKSEADMREQLARIRNLEKQAEADDKKNDKNITVHIDGDDNYSE